METPWKYRYAQRTQRMRSSVIREILKMMQIPGIISFAGGLPAPEVFPIDALKVASDSVLCEMGPQALQYHPTEGYNPLREMIVRRSARYGLHINIENVLITSGSQQALDLLCKVFINRGDRVLVESPSYLGALQAWNAYGAEYVEVPIDEEGMRIDELERAMLMGPKFIYILPNFQNPTGITLSHKRRTALIEVADRYGVPLVEDDPYGQLRYEGKHIPPVVVLDGRYHGHEAEIYHGNTIYLSTFSKILAPGLRLAWIIAPAEVIQKLVEAKQGLDLHTSTFVQTVAHEVGKDGFLDRHIKTIRQVYGERRLVMLEALEKYFPSEVKWSHPQGGMFLWATLPEEMDAKELLKKAVKKLVAYVPGEPFHANGGGKNTLRLNFSNAQPEMIRKGIMRLGQVFKEELP